MLRFLIAYFKWILVAYLILNNEHFRVLLVPDALKILDPLSSELTRLEQIFPTLELCVETFSSSNTRRTTPRYKNPRHFHLHDRHLAESLVKCIDDIHGGSHLRP